ncbi:WhiB family transcriptional regulator [Streptomyces sp. NPDC048521]|uniref:WhiB family transcriptional regulator n=1 Tax=Streptomyces sp. NPDC048521 TaxID=3365566 RepID=UPI00371369D9
MTMPMEKSSEQLRREWEEHPRYRYRGCAPDEDDPRRAAGDHRLTLDAWSGADRDGSEPQKQREARQEAAIDACFGCAVMVQCDAYAMSVRWVNGVPKLAEPEGIWGGRTALERHRLLIESRPELKAKPAPDRMFQTEQKQSVLRALARCWEPVEVAQAAELPDVRTANWQRSALVRYLGLPKTASRMQVLEAAEKRGLLDGVEVVPDDGTVPAIPPASENLLMEFHGQVLLWPSKPAEVKARPRRRPGRGPRRVSLRHKFPSVEGQEDLVVVKAEGLADVREMFPAEAAMEAVA